MLGNGRNAIPTDARTDSAHVIFKDKVDSLQNKTHDQNFKSR